MSNAAELLAKAVGGSPVEWHELITAVVCAELSRLRELEDSLGAALAFEGTLNLIDDPMLSSMSPEGMLKSIAIQALGKIGSVKYLPAIQAVAEGNTPLACVAKAVLYSFHGLDCIVISDLHLGSDICQAALLHKFLEWSADVADVVIINGDIFDDLNFKRLTKEHFACLKTIRKRHDKFVWIRGNHDGPVDVVSHIVGTTVHDEYTYSNGRLSLLVVHGDRFDGMVTDYGMVTELACTAFYFIQKLAPGWFARWVRRTTKSWQRNSRLVSRRACEYARQAGIKYVTCGHTHLPMETCFNGVKYFNTGTWTEHPPCFYLAVRGGEIWLDSWPHANAQSELPVVESAVVND